MVSTPHTNMLLGQAVLAPGVLNDGPASETAGSELSMAITAALQRAVTAKFFAMLGAEGQLRSDLQDVCRAAKRQNMRVEYLIIAFKDAWRTLPEARTLPQGSQGVELLNRIITLWH